jgi:branched-chain amino acid transport system substrate-binding protein
LVLKRLYNETIMRRRSFLKTFGIASLLWAAGCNKKSVPEAIQIGYLAPVTEMDAAARDRARHGIQLAVDEANKEENRIAGRRVEVLFPDCPNEREAVRAAAVRLLTINKAAALLGGTDAGQVEILSLVAETAKVPLVAPGGLPNRTGGGFVFHTGVSPAYQGKVLARFASEQWTNKPIGVLTGLQEGAGPAHSVLATAFTRDYRKNGGQTAGEWTYKNPAELRDLVRLIGTEKPEAVLVAGTVADVMELRKAGLAETLPVVLGTSEGAATPLQTHPLPNAIYLATTFATEVSRKPIEEFVRLYKERFQETPDVQAALAYDSARLLFDGMRRAGTVEGDKVRGALADLKTFESTTGSIAFDVDHWALRPLFILQVSRDKSRTVQTYDPEVG